MVLQHVSPTTCTIVHFQHDDQDANSLSNNDVTALYEDSTGILWVGTWIGGLNALDRQTEDGNIRFSRYQHDLNNPNSIGEGIVWAIFEDPAGDLWVGTAGGGLCRFERQSEDFACYVHDPEDDNSLSNNTVWVIHPGKDGSLWLGTSGGLNHFSPYTGQFTHYTAADGLPHDTVVGIQEDVSSSGSGQGDLWLSTLGGLARFDPQSETIHKYDVGDGLSSNVFNLAAVKTSSGRMLFGGQKGLTAFYPEDVKVNQNPPPVRITSFALSNEPVSVGNDSVLPRSIIETKELKLNSHFLLRICRPGLRRSGKEPLSLYAGGL